MKKEVFSYIANTTGKRFDPNVLTITWARRFADYKRAWLIFMDMERILKLLNADKVQLIFAGKCCILNEELKIISVRQTWICRIDKKGAYK